MRLLLSNDDGILARGLECLERAARPLGDVWVVAPDREQSATSHSLTLHHPLRPVQLGPQRWQVDGTPTDCVMLAIEALLPERPDFVLSGINHALAHVRAVIDAAQHEALLPERPDFVLSGINHGPNMGEDVLYSGTVAAAMEGLALGVPSIAFSFAGRVLRADDTLLSDHVENLTRVIKHITSLPTFPADTLLNVNIPAIPAAEVKGVRLTRLGRRVFSDSLTPMKDPWGREIFWIGGGTVAWSGSEDSDFRAVKEGYISITPLHLDLTAKDRLDDAERWWRPL